jgi:hypothetical protein
MTYPNQAYTSPRNGGAPSAVRELDLSVIKAFNGQNTVGSTVYQPYPKGLYLETTPGQNATSRFVAPYSLIQDRVTLGGTITVYWGSAVAHAIAGGSPAYKNGELQEGATAITIGDDSIWAVYTPNPALE